MRVKKQFPTYFTDHHRYALSVHAKLAGSGKVRRWNCPRLRDRLGAVLWILCVQFFIAEQIAKAGWVLPYSFVTNYISDLGMTNCEPLVCSPWHIVMNMSFAIQGLLIASGAVLEWRNMRSLGRAGLTLLVVCGLGVFMVGYAPSNEDPGAHVAGAALHFVGGGFGILLLGIVSRTGFRWPSVFLGLMVIIATALLGQSSGFLVTTLGVGTIERFAAYGITCWMVVSGVYRFARTLEVTSPGNGPSLAN
jgi:hypothetical membrane protein